MKSKYKKWAHILHMEIQSWSYGKINGHNQINNLIPNPLKPKKQEIDDVWLIFLIWHWKVSLRFITISLKLFNMNFYAIIMSSQIGKNQEFSRNSWCEFLPCQYNIHHQSQNILWEWLLFWISKHGESCECLSFMILFVHHFGFNL